MGPMLLDQWHAGGRTERVFGYDIFVRTEGTGDRHLTFIHGYPTCSWDWSKVWPAMTQAHRGLAFDFLGFGHSEKPRIHYSYDLQLRILELLWKQLEIRRTVLIAHDYGATAALELLARHREGRSAVEIEGVALLNGGLIAAQHHPRPIQRLLATPLLGDLVARFMTEARFRSAFQKIFAVPPTDEDLSQFWSAIARQGGNRLASRLLHYMAERRQNVARWEGMLLDEVVPKAFIWGLKDPISGAHLMAELQRRRVPGTITELADAGHYPQWERPREVERALLQFLSELP